MPITDPRVVVGPFIIPVEPGGEGCLRFPDGFVWGSATAAYQIEGAVDADGRGPSIWDTFTHQAGSTHNGDTGDVACDHYRMLEADLDLLAELGAGAYRFSVAWSRIQPTGGGEVNQAGLDFYRRLVDGLRRRNIAPVATLYHWDLPQALEDAGGWPRRETAQRFADYVAVVARALQDVELWITLNEPHCSAWLGYGSGTHAPGRADIGAAIAATHHLLLGHGLSVDVLRAEVPDATVGITLDPAPIRAATDHEDDVEAATRADGNVNRLFCDPLFKGGYPTDVLAHYERHRPGFTVVADGDLDVISAPIDFLGINYYNPLIVIDAGRRAEAAAAGYHVPVPHPDPVRDDLGFVDVHRPAVDCTAMDWEIEPGGLTELLVGLRDSYGAIPIYVTENGGAFADYVGPDGEVHDNDRIAYVDRHLRAVHEAIGRGVDVRGYFCWSLLDNFEWTFGYSRRFGLTWVDFPTGARLPKASFAWYRGVAASNGLPALAPAPGI